MLVNGVKLGYKTTANGATYTNLAGLKSVPDLGGDPELVDNTALGDTIRHNEIGIGDPGDMAYTFRYKNTVYDECADREGLETWFQEELPDGSTFSFSGFPHVVLNGGGVNDPQEFTMTIALNSDITSVITSS